MLKLPHKHRWPIALDIGADSIKMLQIQRERSLVSVAACSRWRFPQVGGQDPAQRPKLAAEAIRAMLKQNGFYGQDVVTSLSSSQLMIKNLRMPHMPDDEMQQAVIWEIKERFGFDVDRGQVCFLNAGAIRQGTESRDEIVVLFAASETVESHLELLSEVGLRPLHIGAEPVAVFQAFERFLRRRADEQAVSVLVEIGFSATRVIVARGRQIVFIKSIDIGGRKFNQTTAERLNLSYAEAAELRMRVMREHEGDATAPAAPDADAARREASTGADVQWTLCDAVRADVEALSKEIALCLRYCSVTFRGLRPDKVTLVGGEAYDPNLLRLLTDQLGIECVVGQPLRGVDLSCVDVGSDRRHLLTEWTHCAGLACRHETLDNVNSEDNDDEHRLSA